MVEESTNGSGAAEPELRALEAEATVLLARMQFMRQAGVSFKGLRDLYEVLGYDRDITTEQYRERYERGGIAGTIVDVMVDATWRGGMELIEDEDPEVDTAFEAAWQALEERLNLTTYLIRVDRLSRLSDYAVLLIGTSLDGELSSELPKGAPDNFIFLQPYSGGGGPGLDGRVQSSSSSTRARVESYDKDPKSPRFGLPATYSLKLDDGQWASNVHQSRIVHVAENCLEDDVFGRSVLKRTWNLLDDLDKVTGGGSEAFWLRANQGTHLNIDKDLQLDPGQFADVVTKLKAQSELYKHQQTRWLQTRGVDVKTLGSDVANFGGPADAVLKQIAGTTRIPTRILTGSEMGELASSQDRENFKDQVNGRQEQHAGPNIVRRLADRLITYGYLPTPVEGPFKYRVKFAHIQTLTEQEKVEGAKGWASVNATQGEIVFTDAEIREKWADKPPLTDEQRKEIDDRKAEALKMQQEAMAATTPPDKKVIPFKAAGAPDGHPFYGNQYSEVAAGAHEEAAKAHELAGIGNLSSSAAEKLTAVAGKASDKDYPGTAYVKRPDGLREANSTTSAGKAVKAAWQARESEKRRDTARGPQAAQSAAKSRAEYHQEALGHHKEQSAIHRTKLTGLEADDTELLRVLEAAIEAGNEDVVLQLVGLGAQDGHPFYGNQYTDGTSGSDKEVQDKHQGSEHGKVVVSSRLGEVKVVKEGDRTRFRAYRKNGEAMPSKGTLREAKQTLREPKNRESFVSGYLHPDVKWKAHD